MFDMDTITALGVLGTTSVSKLPKYETWSPGEKLKILLVGYNGMRNTGADVRVEIFDGVGAFAEGGVYIDKNVNYSN